MSQPNRKRRWVLLAIVFLLGLGYAGYRAFGTDPDLERVKELRQELSTKGLTPEQRRAAAQREQWRKQMLDDTTPEFRAQLDQYRKDMQARRQQLGLTATPPRR